MRYRRGDQKRRVVCAQCGADVLRFASQVKPVNFCSRKCQGLSKRNGCMLFCAWCDEPFYRHFAEQDIGEKANQFCSRPCYTEWRGNKRTSYPKGEGGRHKHRLVVETVLGRPLNRGEVVHHIDENRQNYDPSN